MIHQSVLCFSLFALLLSILSGDYGCIILSIAIVGIAALWWLIDGD